jgi:hypothetical protein
MWPKQIVKWIENRVLYMSIPFTWLLSEAKGYVLQMSYEWDKIIVGGPAVLLLPGLAASDHHFDLVCDKLEKWGWCDFNQGIDSRFLTPYHAERFKRIGKPILRLALESFATRRLIAKLDKIGRPKFVVNLNKYMGNM